MEPTIYDFQAVTLEGEKKALSDYLGKVLLIVNTASKCTFTPHYGELQALYIKYKNAGLEILGFPCNQFGGQEPGDEEEINQFCITNYGISFQMFSKVKVKGTNAHPMFKYLIKELPGFFFNSIKWNFTKFLLDTEGNPVKRYPPITNPKRIEKEISTLLMK